MEKFSIELIKIILESVTTEPSLQLSIVSLLFEAYS
jgi:hypothetical protein